MTNEEILREQFAAAERRESWPRAMELWDDAAVLVVGDDVATAHGHFFGKEDVGRWFADWLGAFDGVSFELSEVVQGRDGLAAHALHSARGRESGVETAVDLYYAYWFREGKVIRAEIHRDRATAWRAAGAAG